MNVWFTADLHLGHGNIIKYCDRPFLNGRERQLAAEDPRGRWRVSDETLSRHDAALLDAINARVAPGDVLWVVGDFCLAGRTQASRYRARILCRDVRLVRGNHDRPENDALFDAVLDEGAIRIDGQDIWLCHYPQPDWPGRAAGAWHLYGHVHARLEAEDRADLALLRKDVGVDACDYRPWSFDELRAYMAPRGEQFRTQTHPVRPGPATSPESANPAN